MLMIRFQRIGRTNDPAFRIVLLEKERAAQTGSIVEQLGSYNPKTKACAIDGEQVKAWIAKGAQPTDTVRNLLISKGILEGKKVNVLPKKTVPKKEEEAPAAAAAVEAAAPTPEEVAADAVPAEEAAPAEEAPAA
jgi:small subunit ribosomal protein S16